MKNAVTFLVVAALAWYGLRKYQEQDPDAAIADDSRASEFETVSPDASPGEIFSCDGRQHCSEMRSCADAMWVLRNCPNTKVDGDNDGIPCERQWC